MTLYTRFVQWIAHVPLVCHCPKGIAYSITSVFALHWFFTTTWPKLVVDTRQKLWSFIYGLLLTISVGYCTSLFLENTSYEQAFHSIPVAISLQMDRLMTIVTNVQFPLWTVLFILVVCALLLTVLPLRSSTNEPIDKL